jgi:hypothetical protein
MPKYNAMTEIDLPSDEYLDIDPEDLNYGTGDCRSMEDFIIKYGIERHQGEV